jgi:chorismate mutase
MGIPRPQRTRVRDFRQDAENIIVKFQPFLSYILRFSAFLVCYLSGTGTLMDIADWRKKIDELDRQIVELINARAQAAHEIGKLKRNTSMPIYEPDRERTIFENVQRANRGPLPESELRQVYERIIDVMRNIQKNEIVPKLEAGEKQTEFDVEVND